MEALDLVETSFSICQMRYARAAVAVSLALNLLLGIAYWLGPRPPKLEIETLSPRPPHVQVIERVTTNTSIVTPSPRLLDWRKVESGDYQKYVANLRSVGCPEKTIRDVIIADVNDLYRQRYREIFPPTNRVEYWKPGNPMADLFDEKKNVKELELRKEKRELIKALVQSDYDDEQDASTIQLDSFSERLLNFLTVEKRTAMKELEDKFAVKMMQTYKDTWRGNDGPADAIKAEKDDAMLEILTPEEKFEYDLRRSDTAMLLRVGLGDFEVSEEEFRAMFPCLKDFIAEAGKPGFGAVIRGQRDPRPEAETARTAFQASLRAALGEKRLSQLLEQTRWDMKAGGR
jgi:hypothetical protein